MNLIYIYNLDMNEVPQFSVENVKKIMKETQENVKE